MLNVTGKMEDVGAVLSLSEKSNGKKKDEDNASASVTSDPTSQARASLRGSLLYRASRTVDRVGWFLWRGQNDDDVSHPQIV